MTDYDDNGRSNAGREISRKDGNLEKVSISAHIYSNESSPHLARLLKGMPSDAADNAIQKAFAQIVKRLEESVR